MSTKTFKAYLQCDKEYASDLAEESGLDRDEILNSLYEVEFELDASSGEILRVDGRDLAPKTPKETVPAPDAFGHLA